VSDRGWWSGLPPEGWTTGRLKDLVHLTNGWAFDSERFGEVGTPLIRIRDLGRQETETRYDGPFPPEVRVENGDLLVGMDGDFNSAVWTGGPAALNQRLCRLRAIRGLDQQYLGYLVDLPLRYINRLTYATTVKHLSSLDLLDERVPLPPLEQQRAIADFLDAETARIDALITKKRRLIEVLDERLNADLGAIASGRSNGAATRSSGVDWLGEIPAGWPIKRLKFVARLESGHTPSRTRPELWENCTTPWVTLNDVGYLAMHEFVDDTVNKISEEGLATSSARVLPAGTVILSRDATVGRCGILGQPMATSQHFVDWVCSDAIRPRYLWLLFKTVMQSHFDSLTAGATLKTIGIPDVKRFVVPVPPLGEQDAIIRRADAVRQSASGAVQRLRAQIDLLVEHRQALITAAVTGELEVPGVAA